MRVIIVVFVLLGASCGYQNSNTKTGVENSNNTQQGQANDSSVIGGNNAPITTWDMGIEGRNLWNSLRGIYYHKKLDPNFARDAVENSDNLIYFEGSKILNCIADIDFAGIKVFDDSISIAYRNYSEWNGILFFSASLEKREITEDTSSNKFTLSEKYDNNSQIIYEIFVEDIDTFLLRVKIDDAIQKISGFVSSPEMDQDGFYRFYRWSGPTMLYKEWPDGTFDPRKAYEEFVKSREGQ